MVSTWGIVKHNCAHQTKVKILLKEGKRLSGVFLKHLATEYQLKGRESCLSGEVKGD